MSVATHEADPDQTARLHRAQSNVLSWYRSHARDLPWRATRDPYAILVSEIMLQQTQVDRVIPKYLEFLARFPSLERLAEAPLSEVLRVWAPLGYNRRARNLHLAARAAVARFDGSLPNDVAGLRSLPGIGRYTAAAVACFAYHAQVATVDTNIRRVLSRLVLGRYEPVSETEAWRVAHEALPDGCASEWSQALMDIGATICQSGVPRCEQCPTRNACAWSLDGSVVPVTPVAAVGEEPGAYEPKSDPGALRRKARGQLVQVLREAEVNGWLPWEEARSRLYARVPQAETLDFEDIATSLIRDGLLQDRSDGDSRQLALAG